ncbi:MAG: M48 family metalloprotease, partial [Bryobacteraceae bacterium]
MRGWFVWIAGLSTACSLVWPVLGQPAPTAQSPPQIHKEWTLGKEMAQELENRDGRLNDPAMTQYLQGVEDRLAVAAGQTTLEIRLTRSSKLYATVLENGLQYLSSGLVQRLENEMELAGLLAHQLAH